MKVVHVLAISFGIVAVVLLAHHFAKHGYLADQNDVMNHEFFIGTFGALAIGLFVGEAVQSA